MNKGFTFLEVMIAILVLTMGIIIVLQIFPLALNIEKLNQMETQAVFLAQEKIENEISKTYQDIEVNTEIEDSLPSPFERFSRETKVSYVDTGLKKIEVTVRWQSSLRLRGKSVNLITLIAER